MILNARKGFLESYILGWEVYSAEKNEKAMPSVTGQVDLHFFGRISTAQKDEKWKKIFLQQRMQRESLII